MKEQNGPTRLSFVEDPREVLLGLIDVLADCLGHANLMKVHSQLLRARAITARAPVPLLPAKSATTTRLAEQPSSDAFSALADESFDFPKVLKLVFGQPQILTR